ncbi:MAG: TIGR00730 family Rossman fold protein [SAR324 cluster bacterium]|nr:TIGR00730 family Rossman fold protein [SAR324 cluster bacterium]
MKRICVFCGSGPGKGPEYILAARNLGISLVKSGIDLVYGGASVGTMGAIANSVLEAGGKVTGIIPKHLADKEVAFTALSDLRIVDSMHQRKALMEQLSDGFIALPGGLGTIEEFFEVWTWAQLSMHQKPCGLLNVRQYYDKLLEFLDHTVTQQFIEDDHRRMIIVEHDPFLMIERFRSYTPPVADKAKWALKMSNN